MSERIELKSSSLRVLAIGDTHFPYADSKLVSEVVKFAHDFKPTHIVQIGDLYDQYNFSKYPRSEMDTSRTEVFLGRGQSLDFWGAMPPGSAKFQLIGNHCIRMLKKIKAAAPELEQMVKSYWDKIYQFKGVRTLADDRSELVINDILFIHGHLSNLGDHVRINRQSTVVGHSHRGGVVYLRHKSDTLFELNCGHLADDSKLPFAYTPQRTTFWTPGFGTVETLKNGSVSARFIPL